MSKKEEIAIKEIVIGIVEDTGMDGRVVVKANIVQNLLSYLGVQNSVNCSLIHSCSSLIQDQTVIQYVSTVRSG